MNRLGSSPIAVLVVTAAVLLTACGSTGVGGSSSEGELAFGLQRCTGEGPAVEATDAERTALRSQVESAMEGVSSWSVGYGVASGQVQVGVMVLDEETLARLADLAGPLLCVDGTNPEDFVPAGPQPEGGDDWRLLIASGSALNEGTAIATNDQQYAAFWHTLEIDGAAPLVDFESEVVIWFGAGHGGCGLLLEDVVLDAEQRKIHPATVIPTHVGCPDIFVVTSYVVAVPRDRLPEPSFDIHIDPAGPDPRSPEQTTTVSQDLRPAGTEFVIKDEPETPLNNGVVEAGLVIDEDIPTVLKFHLSCSVDVIGPINSTLWRALEQIEGATPPPPWLDDANEGFAEAELLLTSNEPSLTITINNTTISYEPTDNTEDRTMACG